MLATIERGLERLAVWLAAAGALIIVVQTVWISYGVFMRYVVGKPDGTVTEATALLTVFLAIPNLLAIAAFGTPSAASLLISAQSSMVITLQSSKSAHFSSAVSAQFSSAVDTIGTAALSLLLGIGAGALWATFSL